MKTIILESLINFDIGDSVILNPDYTKGLRRGFFERLKTYLGTIVEINDKIIRVRYKTLENLQNQYQEINYKNLKIIKKK